MKRLLYSLVLLFWLMPISCSNIIISNETEVTSDSHETIIPSLSIATTTIAETSSGGNMVKKLFKKRIIVSAVLSFCFALFFVCVDTYCVSRSDTLKRMMFNMFYPVFAFVLLGILGMIRIRSHGKWVYWIGNIQKTILVLLVVTRDLYPNIGIESIVILHRIRTILLILYTLLFVYIAYIDSTYYTHRMLRKAKRYN